MTILNQHGKTPPSYDKDFLLSQLEGKVVVQGRGNGSCKKKIGISNSALLDIFRDLNPLHDVINNHNYKEKYYRSLLPLGQKYAELLPWGDQITAESIRFFSPIVLWTRFASSQEKHDILYSAFRDYFQVQFWISFSLLRQQAWLELLDRATADADASHVSVNREAQHKYLTWRTEKDPGRQILQKLVGESFAEELVRDFLFYGVDSLGSKKFLDFFPQYGCEDGTINKKRSIVGKSFKTRPWDENGEFLGGQFVE
ncbi:Phytochromobilinferredoxin oxidoreductase [Nymphaea thermarum]|nr:Phytochromobilinferredoxin oxidoreductase [Nymphaea thermarum]